MSTTRPLSFPGFTEAQRKLAKFFNETAVFTDAAHILASRKTNGKPLSAQSDFADFEHDSGQTFRERTALATAAVSRLTRMSTMLGAAYAQPEPGQGTQKLLLSRDHQPHLERAGEDGLFLIHFLQELKGFCKEKDRPRVQDALQNMQQIQEFLLSITAQLQHGLDGGTPPSR